MSSIDFGRHSDDYAAFRPGFPASFYARIDAILPLDGAVALDLATGPGTVALELAERGSDVVGIDIAEGQIEAARKVARRNSLENCTDFAIAAAERTGLDSGRFDLITAGQCWHWFDSDAALAESLRLLRPGGILCIAHYSYLAQHSQVVRRTEELILKFNPAWKMAGWTGIFPELIDEVIFGGFELVEQFCYQHEEPFTHAGWRGRMRTCNGVGSGGLSPAQVRLFDAELKRMLKASFPEPVIVPHRVWCVVARKPAHLPAAPNEQNGRNGDS